MKNLLAQAVLIGPFPDPVHGVSVINASLEHEAIKRGLIVTRINVSPGSLRGLLYYAPRLWRVARGVAHILFTQKEAEGCRYAMSVDGGIGQIFNIMFVLAMRVRRKHFALYHHSTNYAERKNWLTHCLVFTSGRECIHVMCDRKMYMQLRKLYKLSGPAIFVDNIAWVSQPSTPPESSDNRVLRLGHLSGLCLEKGLGRAIETLRTLLKLQVPAELIVAGPILDKKAAELLANSQREFGAKLSYLGTITGADKAAFYRSLDAFLFPSLYKHETQSLVVPEALAAGVPVIAYDHRLVGRMVGCGGLVIPSDDQFSSIAASWLADSLRPEISAMRRDAATKQFTSCKTSALQQLEVLLKWLAGELAAPLADNYHEC